MAKDYVKGADYRLYYRSAGNYASPTWSEIKACGDVAAAPQPDDVEVPERGSATGHLHGEQNPQFTFTLFEDKGDSNVEALVAACYSGASVHLAVSRGLINTNGVKYLHMECALFADLSANRPDPSSYAVTAMRHANSDNGLVRATV
jgi:hypothetical protein